GGGQVRPREPRRLTAPAATAPDDPSRTLAIIRGRFPRGHGGHVESTLVSDPVEITPEAVESAVAEALSAVAAAADVAQLKQARAAHQGEGSALAALNAQMRHVPKE